MSDVKVRLLVTKKDAGKIIGYEGKTKLKLQKAYRTKLKIFGGQGDAERIIHISGNINDIFNTLTVIINEYDCYKKEEQVDVRMLINSRHIVNVEHFINGKLKSLSTIKTNHQQAPESNDCVIKFIDNDCEKIIESMKMVIEFMKDLPLCVNDVQYEKYITNKFDYGGYACDILDYTSNVVTE